MCLICVEFKKEKLTVAEGWRNLREMRESMTDEHYDEVVALLVEAYEEEQQDEVVSDEEELASLLEKLEEDGQLGFEWDLGLGNDDLEITTDDDNPWYIPGFED